MLMTHSMFNQLKHMLLYTTSNLVIAVQTCYSHYVRHDNFLYWSHTKKKKKILGAHFFFLLSLFNTFQGTLNALSNQPTRTSLSSKFNPRCSPSASKLHYCSFGLVPVNWKPNRRSCGFKTRTECRTVLASFCNTGVSYDREIQQNIHSTWGEYTRVHH